MNVIQIAIATALIAACTSQPAANVASCAIGETCTLVGTAIIYLPADGEQSWLKFDKKCVALSLPDSVYENRDRWNGRLVKVVGIAYRQPEGTYLYYDIKAKRISAGVCTGQPLIIVDQITLLSRN